MTLALLAVAALIVGFSKTSIGGLATIAVAIFATVTPARESTAAILLLLITGDVVAVAHYRRDCDWSLLVHLLPSVLPGILLGTWFLAVVDDGVLRRSIGAMLAVMAVIQLLTRWRASRADLAARAARIHQTQPAVPGGAAPPPDQPLPVRTSRAASIGTGVLAGFTTMTANAAGAVMALYFVANRVDKRRFLGTSSWFFLSINLVKVPFSAGLGLYTQTTLLRTLVLAPIVVVGALVGVRVARRMSQARFDTAVLAASVLSAAALLA